MVYPLGSSQHLEYLAGQCRSLSGLMLWLAEEINPDNTVEEIALIKEKLAELGNSVLVLEDILIQMAGDKVKIQFHGEEGLEDEEENGDSD